MSGVERGLGNRRKESRGSDSSKSGHGSAASVRVQHHGQGHFKLKTGHRRTRASCRLSGCPWRATAILDLSPVSPISCLLLFLFPPPPVRSQSRIPPVSDVSVLSVFGFCVFLCLPVPSPSPLPTLRHTDTHTLLLLLGKPALPPDAPFREAKVRTTVSHSEGQSLGNCLTPLTQELLLRCPPWPQKHPSGDK